MYVVRVKDRGRDLVWHRVDVIDDADEIGRVYLALGYPPEKIVIEQAESEQPRAA